jgi:hypothetical protein
VKECFFLMKSKKFICNIKINLSLNGGVKLQIDTFLISAHVCTQVPVLSALFFVLFLGNAVTTSMVIPQKLQEQVRFKYQLVGLERLSWGGSKQHGTPQNQSGTTQVSTT